MGGKDFGGLERGGQDFLGRANCSLKRDTTLGFFLLSGYYRIYIPFNSISISIQIPLTFQWSYGITIWEIYTEGCKPYSSVKDQDIELLLQEGKRLLQPERAPHKV